MLIGYSYYTVEIILYFKGFLGSQKIKVITYILRADVFPSGLTY